MEFDVDNREFRRRDVKLYGITGSIFSPPLNPCAAFGGYFKYDVLENLVVDGQLADCWGLSMIEGRMTNNVLEFLKKYHHRDSLVKYQFEDVNGVWVGNWTIIGQNMRGRSHCLTYLVEDDAWDISCGAPVIPGEPIFPRIK